MATHPYSYLKKYVGHNDLKGTYFLPVPEEKIRESEVIMDRKFPSMLKQFYQEIGTGILSCGEKYPEMLVESVYNRVLPPDIAVDYMRGVLAHSDETYYMSEDTYEMLEPGDLPFFEMYDGSSFLYMKLKSVNPNAVWALGNIKIEDSFEKFIWRLYYEDPGYYGDIIEDYYKDK